jgi:hypothetical protein
MQTAPVILTPQWKPLRFHAQQNAFMNSTSRFNIARAGRRSGKTEIAKRRRIRKALSRKSSKHAYYLTAAPTRDQVKRIYWRDYLKLIPKWAIIGQPNKSELTIDLVTGATILLGSFEAPERFEGFPIEDALIDEFDNISFEAYSEHLRPGLDDLSLDQPGSADFIGVPDTQRNLKKLEELALKSTNWSSFYWHAEEILSADAIEQAKRDLDELTYRQEYGGENVIFGGLIYYPFNRDIHAGGSLAYDPAGELIFAFDFNVSPGVANIAQEFPGFTGWIGEVHIPDNSNTPLVCDKLIADWGKHRGEVRVYGDPTGGQRGTAAVQGSDWELIKQKLKPVFGDRISFFVPDGSPKVRVRVNAVNSRLKSVSGDIRMKFDKDKCPHTIEDFESVLVLEGSAGEIDKKKSGADHTHHSDAIGYYIAERFPIVETYTTMEQF